jgi:hypothetical protein
MSYDRPVTRTLQDPVWTTRTSALILNPTSVGKIALGSDQSGFATSGNVLIANDMPHGVGLQIVPLIEGASGVIAAYQLWQMHAFAGVSDLYMPTLLCSFTAIASSSAAGLASHATLNDSQRRATSIALTNYTGVSDQIVVTGNGATNGAQIIEVRDARDATALVLACSRNGGSATRVGASWSFNGVLA